MRNGIKVILTALTVVIVVAATIGIVVPAMSASGVTVVYSQKVNYETLMVAEANGLFSDEGIDTLLVTGGIQAAEALLSGSADLAAMGDSPAIQLICRDSDVRIVARFISSPGMHRIIAVTDIVTPQDLEGRTLGLQTGSSSHGAFLLWAEENGVNVDNITIVSMNPSDLALAMSTGQIDAMVGSEPWAINTENLCGDSVHELGNSSSLGSVFPIVLVASEKILEENPEAVSAVIEILEESTTFILENWDKAMEICSERTGLSMEDQDECSSRQTYAVGLNESDIQSLEMAAEVLLQFDKISSIPDVSASVDAAFLAVA